MRSSAAGLRRPKCEGHLLMLRVDRGRIDQLVLIASLLGLSWLGMQVVHETGHVLLAWVSGETVSKVVLHPLAISRTDVSHDYHPLLVTWGGPVLGSVIPLVALGHARARRSGVFPFFAGFCLIANGLYIGMGWFWGIGDAGDLLRFGSPRWTLLAFGLATAPLGLVLWNGLGPHFGLGVVKRKVALGTLAFLMVVVLVEILTSPVE
jgi:hypothetical protein